MRRIPATERHAAVVRERAQPRYNQSGPALQRLPHQFPSRGGQLRYRYYQGLRRPDVRKYLIGEGTYTTFQTCRTKGNDEVAYNYIANVMYYRSDIENDPNDSNDEFDAGPQVGVTYYVIDTEKLRTGNGNAEFRDLPARRLPHSPAGSTPGHILMTPRRPITTTPPPQGVERDRL